MDFKDLLREERLIQNELKCCESELEAIRREQYEYLADKAKQSSIEYIRYLGEAILHEHCGITPETGRLGYAIANSSRPDFAEMSQEDKELWRDLTRRLDITGYVFSTTHYDEHNGSGFFRRS